MFDPKTYQDQCAQLSLGQEKLEEIITMTENTSQRRLSRPVKTILIAAACVAALTVTAMAAPAVQQLFTTYTITFRNADSVSAFALPNLKLEERDGRSILTVDGLETDVTDAFAKNGQYVANVDGVDFTVTPDGWVEITIETNEDSGSFTYTFSLSEETPLTGVDAVKVDSEILEALEMGSYSITTDESGAVVIAESEPLYLPE